MTRLTLSLFSASLLALGACQAQEVRTMTPSNVGSESLSQTNTGLDASRYLITQVDLSQMDDEDMIPQMIREMEALDNLFAKTRNAVDVESSLKQVELAGINYRTMILRVQRAIDQGDDNVAAVYERRGRALQRAHSDLLATGERLARQYPELETRISEKFDKFDFGMLARSAADRREAARLAPRTGGADARDGAPR